MLKFFSFGINLIFGKSDFVTHGKIQSRAGLLMLIAYAQLFYITSIAEGLFPGYDVRTNYISDLAVQPESAFIWTFSMVITGFFTIIGALLLYCEKENKIHISTIVSILLAGIGIMGIALFNENTFRVLHLSFALVTFVCGGLSCITISKTARGSFIYFSHSFNFTTVFEIISAHSCQSNMPQRP